MQFDATKVLVTGGAGFLGSHLVDALVAQGAVVTVVDNLSTGRLDNIAGHIDTGAVTFIDADICDLPDVSADVIFNLACPASPLSYQADPIGTWRTSVIGGAKVVELAHKNGARLVHLSTSEVYGDPLHHPQSEGDWGNVNPNGLRACYDEGKRALEALCMDYHRIHALDVRIARVFNTYGPRMQPDDGRAIPTFMRQALMGEALTIQGNGEQTRSFCYVSDLIAGILALAQVEGALGQVINLGNPVEISIRTLCDAIAVLVPFKDITYQDAASDDPGRRCPNIARARDVLGWQPKVDLADGLLAVMQDQRAAMAIAAN